MPHFAYLRVSRDTQDVEKQRHGIVRYCAEKNIEDIVFFEDEVSGTKDWRERKLGNIITAIATSGDVLVFSEISRIGRSTLQVLEVLQLCLERNIQLHIAKQGMVFDDSLSSKVMAIAFGMASEIERYLISERTKEALSKLKMDGVQLGRPKGEAKYLKLDEHEIVVRGRISRGDKITHIARDLGVSKQTLYNYMARRGIRKPL